MDIDPSYAKSAAGFGGALVAAFLKFKDGLRVVGVYLVVGIVAVWSVRSGTDWLALKWDVPPDVVGFVIGFAACSALNKLTETIANLQVAPAVNAFLERWLGAKSKDAPPADDPPKGVQP